MKKNGIYFLLCLPFMTSVLAFVTTVVIIKKAEHDITDINWDYSSQEAFALKDGKVMLKASPVYNQKYPLGDGNQLVWSVESLEGFTDVAQISNVGQDTFLLFEKEGKCLVTCSNEKKTVSKKFEALIYGAGGAVIVNPIHSFSQKNIDKINYVGIYEYRDGKKVKSPLGLNIQTFGGSDKNRLLFELPEGWKMKDDALYFEKEGRGELIWKDPYSSSSLTAGKMDLGVVDGVNVFSYEDLLKATNESEEGEKVVLRVNLESKDQVLEKDSEGKYVRRKDISANTQLFGNFDYEKGTFSFDKEVYRFKTTYNSSYIESWNASDWTKDQKEKKADTDIVSGIRIQNDFYGNGFSINAHDLAYPSGETNQGGILVPSFKEGDLFRGPKIFASLGIPKVSNVPGSILPLFALYGQDNIGFYVDGNDITLNDVDFRNCDFGDNLMNLQYTGTVLETHGRNITIKNSRIHNGRSVLRSYSSLNVTLENSLLQNALDYLVRIGTNEALPIDEGKEISYPSKDGMKKTSAKDYLTGAVKEGLKDPSDPNASENMAKILSSGKGDTMLTYGAVYNTPALEFFGLPNMDFSKDDFVKAMDPLRESLFNTKGMYDGNGKKIYKGSMTISDCFFGSSGIHAISLDSYANGSYLESNTTSLLPLMFMTLGDSSIRGDFINVMPEHLSLTSYPILLELRGDNRFFDWKEIDDLDYSTMLFQDISNFILAHGGLGNLKVDITDDDYLPLRALLKSTRQDTMFSKEEKKYVNYPIIKQGGGKNMADVVLDEQNFNYMSSPFELDPYSYSLDKKSKYTSLNSPEAKLDTMKIAMSRATFDVLGFNPWTYYSLKSEEGKWFNEQPDINELIKRS